MVQLGYLWLNLGSFTLGQRSLQTHPDCQKRSAGSVQVVGGYSKGHDVIAAESSAPQIITSIIASHVLPFFCILVEPKESFVSTTDLVSTELYAIGAYQRAYMEEAEPNAAAVALFVAGFIIATATPYAPEPL